MKKTLAQFRNHMPRTVMTGRGQSLLLKEICSERGWRRAVIVCDEGVERAGLLKRVAEPMESAGLLAGIYSSVPTEPPIETSDSIASQLQESDADVVIGLGGGSVMDATKVAALAAHHRLPARNFIGIGKAGARGLATILIPTTAGTGSEATFVAILTDTLSGNKVGVVDPNILADIAIVDPSLTDGLPAAITAAAGMDAMVHSIEAYIAKVATPIARALALEAAKHLGPSILEAYQNPLNEDARDGMAIGSHLAGIAFANSSCCAVHALSLPLGGRFPISHGVITGCFAAEVMRHNLADCQRDFEELSVAFGWGQNSPETFCDRLDKLAIEIGLRDQLAKTPVPETAYEAMAREAVNIRRLMDPNPRDVAVGDAARIYRTVLG